MIIRIMAFLFFLCIGYNLFIPKAPHFDCHPASQLIHQSLGNKQAFQAGMITERAEVLQLFVNMETREWTIIAIDGELKDRGCLIITGKDFLLPGEISL